MLNHNHSLIKLLLVLLLQTSLCASAAAITTKRTATELLSDNVDVEIAQYQAKGDYLILWIAPEFGFRQGQYDMASLLSSHQLEVWLADITESLFLPRGSSSMRELDGQYVAELIQRAHQKTGKKVILVSSFYGAIPVLRGARQWQRSSEKQKYLLGAVLFSPTLYTGVPSLGKDPEYLPIADATNIPLMIFQGQANGMRWQLMTLLQKLYLAGSPVYTSLMPGITSLFYPEERDAAVQQYFNILPQKIQHAIHLLEQSPAPAKPINIKNNAQTASKNIDIELKKYRGDIDAKPFSLLDTGNKRIDMKDFIGNVTVVNFWATWCPPCVEEIPSLNRLMDSIDHPKFKLISINYVESPETINAFMDTVKVNFPVLLDQDGSVSSAWKVIVFPSTYVIGMDGKIKYGVNAAIQWDNPKTIQTLKQLLGDNDEKADISAVTTLKTELEPTQAEISLP